MPWTGKTFSKHNKSLSPAESSKAAEQANAVLAQSGDEGMAIAVANKQAGKMRREGTGDKRNRSNVRGIRQADFQKGTRGFA